MSDILQQLHLLRPAWLLALLPLALLCGWLMRHHGTPDTAWQRAIDPDLLPHLLDSETGRPRRLPLLLGAGWLLAAVALAGPVWEKLPQPVLQQRDALVVVLDLSLSMYATDVSPTRLQRARFKLHDLLQQREEGLTGLVVYSGDAHVVTPLTDDTATIANLLPALTPDLMPLYGSNPVAGVALAADLLANAEVTYGRILLVTDDLTERDLQALPASLGNRWQLSILGVGTTAGAPVKLGDGLLRDRSGEIVIPQLPRDRLQALAAATGGRYSDLRMDDGDLEYLVPPPAPDVELQEIEQRFDQWRERGHWLVVLLLPLAALAARRGWLLSLLLATTLAALPAPPAAARTTADTTDRSWSETLREQWRNLWQRPDQQGAAAYQRGALDEAAARFRNPAWRGTALYEAGDFEAAAESFAELDTADGHYNRANALAQAGHFRQALVAYDAALALEPEHEDAAFNRRLVEEALRRQTEPQQGEQRPDQQQRDGDGTQGDARQDPDQRDDSDQQERPDQPAGQGSQDTPPDQQSDGQSDSDQGGADSEQRGDDPGAQDNATRDQPPSAPEQTGPHQTGPDQSTGSRDTAIAGEPTDNEDNTAENAAVERWLRRIPDDPGGLLRRKFEYESRQRAGQQPRRDPDQPLW